MSNTDAHASTGRVLGSLLGNTLISRKGQIATERALHGKRVIGLFFTAAVCDRCRAFTPALATVYRNMRLREYQNLAMRHKMEIVLISMDANAIAFHDYLLQTPFAALPLHRRDLVHTLIKTFDVQTIPSVVFINEHAELIEPHGRVLIDENYRDLRKIWKTLNGNGDS